MAKAETGVAGSVVAEVAYRNDYIALRAQSKLADEAWRRIFVVCARRDRNLRNSEGCHIGRVSFLRAGLR